MILFFLLLIINLALMALAILSAKRENQNVHQRDITKHLGVLEMVWSAFSILLALYFTFGIIERTDKVSFLVAAGGSKIALLTLFYGFGIFHFFISAIIILRLLRSRVAS